MSIFRIYLATENIHSEHAVSEEIEALIRSFFQNFYLSLLILLFTHQLGRMVICLF